MNKHASFLEELLTLASLASMRTGLKMEVGASSSPWSFNWASKVVTVNGADLEMQHPDYCRGLVLHEAAHAAVTRLEGIVPENLMRDDVTRHLLNVIEDCRIETWLPMRLPGSAEWIRLYNNTTVASFGAGWRKMMAENPPMAFLVGIIHRWWTGNLPPEICPLAAEAIERVWPFCMEAIQATPPAEPPPVHETTVAYAAHAVFRCHRDIPSAMEMAIRMSQHAMWTIVWRHILPVLRSLIEESGIDLPPYSPPTLVVGPGFPLSVGRGTIVSAAEMQQLRNRLAEAGEAMGTSGDYQEASTRLSGLIEPLAAAIIRHLSPEKHPRYRRFQPSGQRLDLRMASQFEADPRIYDRLWQQRTVPTKPDPAFVILVDTSGSMRGKNAEATFEALVILREVCLRTGIALAILGFDSNTRMLQDWNNPNGCGVVAAIESVREPSGRSTNIAAALDQAGALCEESSYRECYVWLLSDGKPDDKDETIEAIENLESCVTGLIALGLGPETRNLETLVPGAVTGLTAAELPSVVSQLFEDVLVV